MNPLEYAEHGIIEYGACSIHVTGIAKADFDHVRITMLIQLLLEVSFPAAL